MTGAHPTPKLIAQVLAERRASEPLRRHHDPDFGPLWLLPTPPPFFWKKGEEWRSPIAPPTVEWFGVLSIRGQTDCLVRIECDDRDHRANKRRITDYLQRSPDAKGRSLQALLDAWALDRLRPPSEGWMPQYFPVASLDVKVDERERSLYRKLRVDPVRVITQMRRRAEGEGLSEPEHLILSCVTLPLGGGITLDGSGPDYEGRYFLGYDFQLS